jgi:cytochrome P450
MLASSVEAVGDVVQLDVDLFAEPSIRDPAGVQGALREAGSVVWLAAHSCYATGRDAVVREVLTDPARFSSSSGVGLVDTSAGAWQRPSAILEVDPPDHDAPRRVLNRILSPRALRDWRAEVQRVADELVDAAVDRVEVDAVADLAARLPFTVLPDAVGVVPEGREHLLRYSAMYFNARAPGTPLTEASAIEAEAAGSLPWVREQCRREQLAPAGFGAEIYAAADAGEIDEDTAGGLVRSFLSGGIDTTVLTLGSLLLGLASHPEQWRALLDDPTRSRQAFDEAMRWMPGAAIVGRTTSSATELAGEQLEGGRKLLCLMVGANRDPRRWDRPDEFDIARPAAQQLGFGIGPHFCVGHAVARLEAECLITALTDKVATIELTGSPEPATSNWLAGPSAVPIRLIGR